MKRLLLALALALPMLGPAPPNHPAAEAAPIECTDPSEPDRWRIIGDRVMFGRSHGSVSMRDGHLSFHGTVKPRRGGGWCSARRDFDEPLDIGDRAAIRMRVRGDGKTYGFNLRDNASLGGTYWEAAVPTTDGEWTDVLLAPADFRPLALGSPTEADEPLDRASIRSIALVVANGQTGSFRIEIESIMVDAGPAP